jgi:DNA-directed RNA polymerase specialized sigma24 family protein
VADRHRAQQGGRGAAARGGRVRRAEEARDPRHELHDEEIERVEQIVDADGAGYLEALATLPEPERDAVNARVLEERDYPDIAAAQGASPAAIRQRVSRGLAKLARAGRGGT